MAPCAIVSLRALMEKFAFGNWVPVLASMMQLEQVASYHASKSEIPSEMKARASEILLEAGILCAQAGLHESLGMVQRLNNEQFRAPVRFDELQHAFYQLMRLMESEADKRLFFVLQADDAKRYAQEKPFGRAVFDSFGSARLDATEASNCFALGRYSASVHHSMLALEPGLRALAAYFGLVLPRRTWAAIIEKIEARIDEERKLRKPPTTLDLQFASAAATQFTYVREAWRNHSAHGRGEYDREQALSILEHTKTMMRALATKLQE